MNRPTALLVPLFLVALSACGGGSPALDGSADGATPEANAADGGSDGAVIPVVQDAMAPDATGDATPDATPDASTPTGDGAASDSGPEGAADVDAAGEEAGTPESGAAEAGCPTGDLSCNGACVPSEVHNCGVCGHDCTGLAHVSGTTSCTATGACAFPASSCAPGWADCDGNPDDGCETDITQPTNCGSCGDVCPANLPVCAAGACTSGCPAAAPTLCGSTCADITSDPGHCGSCSTMCTTAVAHALPVCAASSCGFQCNAGYTNCGGVCDDLTIDDSNCGSCGKICGGGETCQAGSCACPSGQTLCGSACTSTSSDNANCGTCGNACVGGETCQSGACVCPPGQTFCGGACTSTSSDNSNCGACGNACIGGESCEGGACVCPAGQTFCGSACTSTSTDGANCGACGHACTGGETCQSGVCACPAGETLCGGTCVNEANDESNCGACGHGCLGGTCSGGQCQPITLTTFSQNGTSITLDASNVYFTNDSALYACPKTGCASPTLYTTAKYGFVHYAPTTVVFQPYLWVTQQESPSTGTSFFDQDLLGGALNYRAVLQFATQMTSDANNIYVGFNPGIMEVPLNNPGNARQLVDSAPDSIESVAVDPVNNDVYGGGFGESTAIIRASTLEENGAFTIFAQQQAKPWSIAIADGNVYWANVGTTANNYQDGGVYMCATGATCASPIILTRDAFCSAVTTDASSVYFLCNATVYRCPLSGCGTGPTPLATTLNVTGPTLTNDATALYWVNEVGQLVKLAK